MINNGLNQSKRYEAALIAAIIFLFVLTNGILWCALMQSWANEKHLSDRIHQLHLRK